MLVKAGVGEEGGIVLAVRKRGKGPRAGPKLFWLFFHPLTSHKSFHRTPRNCEENDGGLICNELSG